MVRPNHSRRNRHTEKKRSGSPDRGQVILIGAITLAFIILGVVVIFNGVLYTETLSSADTGQSASTAEKTELEIEQGIGCLIASHDNEDPFNGDELESDINAFNEVYQNATANSKPAAVNVEVESDLDSIDLGELIEEGITVTIEYDSNDVSYEQERTIQASDCPGES